LIRSFLRGSAGRSDVGEVEKRRIIGQIKAEIEAHNDVPSKLENYLQKIATQDAWPPQAATIALRYLRHRSSQRFVSWRKRQQLIADLGSESIPGTELGFRQRLYSQGAGAVFRWRDVPCFKTNYDLAIYAMLIDELRPGTIIELGSGAGGSAL